MMLSRASGPRGHAGRALVLSEGGGASPSSRASVARANLAPEIGEEREVLAEVLLLLEALAHVGRRVDDGIVADRLVDLVVGVLVGHGVADAVAHARRD